MSDENPMGQVIQIDEARIRDHLGEMVRGTVEETLNAMLDAEADQLCGAGRYERSQARQDTRAGSYERTLQTGAGEVNLKIPKLRRQTFETAIIERYRRRESSVEEALIEMYLAGISVRRAADLVERSVSETLTYYAFPDIHWHKIRTTDEIDKPFLLRDLLFWRGRVTAWQARGCQPGRAAVTVAPHWRHPCAGYQDHAAAIG